MKEHTNKAVLQQEGMSITFALPTSMTTAMETTDIIHTTTETEVTDLTTATVTTPASNLITTGTTAADTTTMK